MIIGKINELENVIAPLYNSKTLFDINGFKILDFPLNVIKGDNLEIIKNIHLNKCKDNYVFEYEYEKENYLILLRKNIELKNKCNLAIFENGLLEKNELGIFVISEKIEEEILELDQNLQSALSIEIMTELMYENTKMKKYIPLIESKVKVSDLEENFFFDDFVKEMFLEVFIEVLNDNRIYSNDEILEMIKGV